MITLRAIPTGSDRRYIDVLRIMSAASAAKLESNEDLARQTAAHYESAAALWASPGRWCRSRGIASGEVSDRLAHGHPGLAGARSEQPRETVPNPEIGYGRLDIAGALEFAATPYLSLNTSGTTCGGGLRRPTAVVEAVLPGRDVRPTDTKLQL